MDNSIILSKFVNKLQSANQSVFEFLHADCDFSRAESRKDSGAFGFRLLLLGSSFVRSTPVSRRSRRLQHRRSDAGIDDMANTTQERVKRIRHANAF